MNVKIDKLNTNMNMKINIIIRTMNANVLLDIPYIYICMYVCIYIEKRKKKRMIS